MKFIFTLLLFFVSLASFSQEVTVIWSNDSTPETAKVKLDTLAIQDSLAVMQTILTREELKIPSGTKCDKIKFIIYYNKNGTILKEYDSYNPTSCEIVFFYARNYAASKAEMFFKFGDELKDVYANHDFKQDLEIVKLLEHKIFGVDSFSGLGAYRALQETE